MSQQRVEESKIDKGGYFRELRGIIDKD